jgi:hypothetical protein
MIERRMADAILVSRDCPREYYRPGTPKTGPIESLFAIFATSCYVTPGTLCCFRDVVLLQGRCLLVIHPSFLAEASMLLNR